MKRRDFLRRLGAVGSGAATAALTGCGTLFHQDRIHQPRSRDIDWEVVALNGLGLAFFFVPGVVAFVVDFYTGAIYLPPTHSQSVAAGVSHPIDRWNRVAVPCNALNPTRIESVVGEKMGCEFCLTDKAARVSDLEGTDRLAEHCNKHIQDSKFGESVKSFFKNRRNAPLT